MKCFCASYGDAIRFDKKPNEDFYLISKKFPIFIVADGVTRGHFSDGRYACRYGAKKAAEIFCRTVLWELENKFWEKGDVLQKIKYSFDLANEKIKHLNTEEGIDKKLNYVEYDWLDTVGVVGLIQDKKLYYGYVGDCGLAIFDKKNNKKFQTEDMVADRVAGFANSHPSWYSYSKGKRRYLIKSQLRNSDNGQGYGTFSGQEGVKNYYVFGSKELSSQDMVVFYSDGFLEYLDGPKFVDILRQENKRKLNNMMFWKILKNIFKYGHDRTLISIKIEG
jgi:serine/threonine protein phosphatase PrpC